MIKRKLLIFTLGLVLLITVLFISIQKAFLGTHQKDPFPGAEKNWSHRGYALEPTYENTKQSIIEALKRNYAGVEIDLWLYEDSLLLGHEYEVAIENGKELKSILKDHSKQLFWLDLKNLSIWNARKVIEELENSVPNKENIVIESKSAMGLAMLSADGFKTSFWINPHSKFHFGEIYQRFMISAFDYNAISMPAHIYLKNRESYKHLNILLWDKEPDHKLYSLQEVKIILDDRELSKPQ